LNLQDLLGHVDKKWRKDFVRFIDTGEAGDEFLDYLNHDSGGQQAVEMAFTAHANSIQGLAEELKNAPAVGESVQSPAHSISNNFAQAIEGVLELAPEQQARAVQEATSSLLHVARPGRQREIAAVADAFKQNLDKMTAES
jgi:hypothetical protein